MDDLTPEQLDASGFTQTDYSGVGPQFGGTYNIPTSAQPNNQPWDAAGGTLGQYNNDVFSILQQGIGAWSQNKKNQQFLDYQRYEATNGGVYAQGQANPTATVGAKVTVGGINPMMLILLIGGAVLLLRK